MPRFFLPPDFIITAADPLPETVSLCGEDAFHLAVSLRARPGEEVTVCAVTGLEMCCRIREITGGKKNPAVLLEPISAQMSQNESPVSLTLFQGMPKGKKTDSILQKCTELGVDRVVFIYTDRSVPVMDGEEKKTARFRKIAQEAAGQCGRGKLVQVDVLESLDEAILEMKKSQLSFACYEGEEERSVKELIASSDFSSASFLIGPEGGLSPRETALLKNAGIPTVSLGKRILRTETAPVVVMSMFLYEKEL